MRVAIVGSKSLGNVSILENLIALSPVEGKITEVITDISNAGIPAAARTWAKKNNIAFKVIAANRAYHREMSGPHVNTQAAYIRNAKWAQECDASIMIEDHGFADPELADFRMKMEDYHKKVFYFKVDLTPKAEEKKNA